MLKQIKIRTARVSCLALAVVASMSVSCGKDVNLTPVDETKYTLTEDSYGYLQNFNNARAVSGLELRNPTLNQNIVFGLTKAIGKDITVTVNVDRSLVDKYNEANFTTYAAFPTAQVNITGSGSMTVPSWRTESTPSAITLTKGTLTNGQYLLAVTINQGTVPGDIKPSADSQALYYIITVGDPVPDNTKPYKILAYVEVNNTNILNVGSYTLKNSGKQFFDIAVIFAANINYDYVAQRVHLTFNANVKQLLTYRDQYIKPLQDKGIKVILGLLGNHDFTGVANLQGQVAENFVAECKATLDAYGLDGCDLDDEWSNYSSTSPYGAGSGLKVGRLINELRRQMPEKLITVYNYGYCGSIPATVDGKTMSSQIDLGMYPSYGGASVTVPAWCTKARYAPTANWVNNRTPSAATLRNYTQTYVVNNGFGACFFYDMRTASDADAIYFSAASQPMFGEDVVASGPAYAKDW